MARLIRAQTADGVTVIEFLDDVMQDRTDGFKTHHRIAAAKELIVHIVRDEQGSHTPSPSTRETDKRGDSDTPSPLTGEGWGEGDSSVVPAEAGIQGSGGGRSTAANPAHPEPSSTVVPAKSLPRTRYGAGTQGGGGGRSTAANPAHPEPSSTVVHAKAGTHPRDPDPGSQLETNNSKLETLPARRTRTQRRREGAARAATRRKALGSELIEEEKNEKPAPVELTPTERRIKEKLNQHWHEPDPYGAPIDSTHPGRSPPW